jgi:hypothetical protein
VIVESEKIEKIAVCRVEKNNNSVRCDIYVGGEFIETKTVPKEKVRDIFSE